MYNQNFIKLLPNNRPSSQPGLHELIPSKELPTHSESFELLGDLLWGLALGLGHQEEAVQRPQQAEAGKQQEAVRAQAFL